MSQNLVPMKLPPSADRPGVFKRLGQAVSYALSGGWFGPEDPIPATHQETAGRAFDYMAGQNLYIQPRRETGVTFQELRGLAGNYDLLRLIIETRKDEICGYEWSIVPKDEADQRKTDAATKAKIDAVTAFFKQPSTELNWHGWLRSYLEDMFVLDAVAHWPVYKGKKLVALEQVDAATITRLIDISGRTPQPPLPAYRQVLKGVPASTYTREELQYRIRNPASFRLYGLSPVEQIMMTVNIGLRRELSQLQFFTEGNIPEALISVPEDWLPEQIAQFQTYWDAMLEGNSAARRHAKFVPGNLKVLPIRTGEDTLKGDFDEWLIRIMCYAFSLSPMPFLRMVNRATASTQQETAVAEGLLPLMNYLRDEFTAIINVQLGEADLQFRWNVQTEISAEAQSGIDKTYIELGVLSVDEVRERKGQEPIGVGHMIWTGSGPVPVEKFADGTAPGLREPAPPMGPGGEPPKPGEPPKGGAPPGDATPPGGKPPAAGGAAKPGDKVPPKKAADDAKKGDLGGHDFRGNQFVNGSGGPLKTKEGRPLNARAKVNIVTAIHALAERGLTMKPLGYDPSTRSTNYRLTDTDGRTQDVGAKHIEGYLKGKHGLDATARKSDAQEGDAGSMGPFHWPYKPTSAGWY